MTEPLILKSFPKAILHIDGDAVFLPSDYETYSILSKRFFNIVRRFTPDVEEYGIDECFADITGLRRPFHMSYFDIAEKIKKELDVELGFTFSIGLAPNKVLAKIGSKWNKPSGLTAIEGKMIHVYLKNLPVEKVWGIGSQTSALMQKYGIKTALNFAERKEEWVRKYFSKPFLEIWQELNGNFVITLDTEEKTTYQSIQKMKTFSPASNDYSFVFAQLSKNVENACMKARRFKLSAKGAAFFLRTQDFRDLGEEIKFSRETNFSHEVLRAAESVFKDIFSEAISAERVSKIYKSIDEIREKYGKHTLFFGSSFDANKFSQHLGDRGDAPERRSFLLKGETKRKRLAIPIFLGKIS